MDTLLHLQFGHCFGKQWVGLRLCLIEIELCLGAIRESQAHNFIITPKRVLISIKLYYIIMEKDIEEKQAYLREQIIDKGYPPEEFAEFLMNISENGGDLEKWSLRELVNAVTKYTQAKVTEEREQKQRNERQEMEDKKREETVRKQQKEKEEEEDFKKFPQLFYAKYNLYDQSFRKKIKCQKIDKFLPRDIEKFQVVIDKPQIRKTGGIFGFGGVNKLWFAMRNNIANKEVMRADEDFEWLRNSYLRLYPGKMIPPLEPIKQNSIEDKVSREIRANMVRRFLEGVSKDREIFNTELTITFLTTDSKNIENFKKKINGINSIRVLSAMATPVGHVEVEISPLNHTLLEAAAIFSNKSSKIYSQLKTISSAISKNLEELTHNIYKFGEGFAQLQQTYSRSIEMSPDLLNPKLSNTFINLNNMLVELGRTYNLQKQSIERNFSYFFRYNKLESESVIFNLDARNKIQEEYLTFKSDLLKRKEQVYSNPLQWELPASFLATINPKELSKEDAMKLILPKETDKQNRLKDWLSFVNKRMEVSYEELLENLADRYVEVFKGIGAEFATASKSQEDVFQRMVKSVAD